MLTIWHNPRCTKSRQTLALIEEAGVDVTIRRYLEDAPTKDDIQIMLQQLGFEDPRDLMRTGERIYKEKSLKTVSDRDVLIAEMAQNSILIERPVVSNGVQAIIGRPPEAIKTLL